MIHEIARITIEPKDAEAFEAAVAACADLFRNAAGCRGMALQRCIESPAIYELRVAWDSIEDHTVHFRQSAAFQDWRARAGPFFAEPPKVDHVATVLSFVSPSA
jgi:quinol monooxygenase YgiN